MVAIIGMSGAGKSTAGELLRKEGYTVYDLDTMIEEHTGQVASDYLQKVQRDEFLKTSALLVESIKEDAIVIIGAGSLPILSDKKAKCIALICDPFLGWSRRRKHHVTFASYESIECISERINFYAAFPIIDTSNLTPGEVVERIKQLMHAERN